jgi:hypothetical protein
MRELKVLEPSVEPIAQDEYTNYLRIAAQLNPVLLVDKLIGARIACEKDTSYALVSQQWDFFMDQPPGIESNNFGSIFSSYFGHTAAPLELPKPPMRTVDGIYLTDSTGTEVLVDPSVYTVSRAREPGRIVLSPGSVWPDTGSRTFETFRIRVTCGYATPFTADLTGLITAPRHGYREGDQVIVRENVGTLPEGLVDRTPYFAIAVTGDTLMLANTPGGDPIVTTSTGDGNTLLGEIPPNLRRGILAIAASDFFGDHKGKTPPGVEDLPDLAEQWLRPFKRIRL